MSNIPRISKFKSYQMKFIKKTNLFNVLLADQSCLINKMFLYKQRRQNYGQIILQKIRLLFLNQTKAHKVQLIKPYWRKLVLPYLKTDRQK